MTSRHISLRNVNRTDFSARWICGLALNLCRSRHQTSFAIVRNKCVTTIAVHAAVSERKFCYCDWLLSSGPIHWLSHGSRASDDPHMNLCHNQCVSAIQSIAMTRWMFSSRFYSNSFPVLIEWRIQTEIRWHCQNFPANTLVQFYTTLNIHLYDSPGSSTACRWKWRHQCLEPVILLLTRIYLKTQDNGIILYHSD